VTKPIVKNGPFVIGQTVTVPLSCDHRLFDGAIGAHVPDALKQLIEASALLLVRGARWQSSRDLLP